MAENQTEHVNKRGGKREGAGRRGIVRSMLMNPQFAKARGISPLYASEILGHVIDERRAWTRIFNSPDDRIVLDALKFLVAMRDGKPAQQINVTSQSLSFTVSDADRAREIVRELRAEREHRNAIQSQSDESVLLASPAELDRDTIQLSLEATISEGDTIESQHDTSSPNLGLTDVALSSPQTKSETSIMLRGDEGPNSVVGDELDGVIEHK